MSLLRLLRLFANDTSREDEKLRSSSGPASWDICGHFKVSANVPSNVRRSAVDSQACPKPLHGSLRGQLWLPPRKVASRSTAICPAWRTPLRCGICNARTMPRPRRFDRPGRPALWGPRRLLSIRPTEILIAQMETAAAERGLDLAVYAVVALAEVHGVQLPNMSHDPRQEELPLAKGA